MKISNEGKNLIKFFEGTELTAYPDPATKDDPIKKGKPWTIGVGHTGPEVKKGMKITEEEADELLAKDLEKFEKGVLSLVNVELTQSQFDALVAFTFNIGLGAFGGSTMLKKLNARAPGTVPTEFLKWNKANGKVMKGLTRRRTAEAAMFSGKDWTAALAELKPR